MTVLETRRELLDRCVQYHGHLCMGQVLGVLLAEKGMRMIGTQNPKEMIVIAENDRCIADAIQTVTGTRLGRRSFKLRDYGKMAATFINQRSGKTYRVWVRGNLPKVGHSPDQSEDAQEKILMQILSSEIDDIIGCRPVKVELSADELPGKPRVTVICDLCGEKVMDAKHKERSGKRLCLSCAEGGYYTVVKDEDH